MNRRDVLKVAAGSSVSSGLGLLAAPGAAQPLQKPVKLVAAFPAGGSADAVARLIALHLQGAYASTVLVENRAGAGGRIGTTFVRNAAPDGATFLVSTATPITLYPHIYKKLPYAVTDLIPVAKAASTEYGFSVGPGVPSSVKTMNDFAKWVKLDPGNVKFGSGGAGSGPHFVGMQLGKVLGLALEHVPFQGTAPLNQAVMGGHIPLSVDILPGVMPSVASGRMRLLATSGAQRSVSGVPTMVESGYPKFVFEDFYGVFAPQKTLPDVVSKLGAAINGAVQNPKVIEGLKTLGLTPAYASPQTFALEVKSEYERWGPLVKASGFTSEE
ncbi:Bug family tripartite tricarboxylate transporter substrate binding protein [Variovorax sp. LT1R20]|uniref:Bug family tripartite tricarboxylate transporter substrate binding protein n=1 Tax=Variovorax sp. LT1R20 TaxID=3443729 RepID=UPI003F484C5C